MYQQLLIIFNSRILADSVYLSTGKFPSKSNKSQQSILLLSIFDYTSELFFYQDRLQSHSFLIWKYYQLSSPTSTMRLSMIAIATVLANAALPMAQRPKACSVDAQCFYSCEEGNTACRWSPYPSPDTKLGKCSASETGKGQCYIPCDSNSNCGPDNYCNTSTKKCVFKDSNGAKCSEDNTCASDFCLNGECSTTAGKKSCTKADQCTGLGSGNRICSSETQTCLESKVRPGNQCQITEQCDQGYSFEVCCQSGKCNACVGTSGATCSDDAGCNSGLKCLQRDARFSHKLCTPTDGAEKSVCSSDSDCKDGRACYKAENDSRELCNNKNGLFNSPCDATSGKEGDGCAAPLACYEGKCQRSGQNCLRRGAGCLFKPNSCCDGLECKGSSSDLEVICRVKQT